MHVRLLSVLNYINRLRKTNLLVFVDSVLRKGFVFPVFGFGNILDGFFDFAQYALGQLCV